MPPRPHDGQSGIFKALFRFEKPQLVLPRQLLERVLRAECVALTWVASTSQHPQRRVRAGVGGAQAEQMFDKTLQHVERHAGVERAVFALE